MSLRFHARLCALYLRFAAVGWRLLRFVSPAEGHCWLSAQPQERHWSSKRGICCASPALTLQGLLLLLLRLPLHVFLSAASRYSGCSLCAATQTGGYPPKQMRRLLLLSRHSICWHSGLMVPFTGGSCSRNYCKALHRDRCLPIGRCVAPKQRTHGWPLQ